MNQGIIRNFKCNYWKTLFQHILAEIEEKDKYETIKCKQFIVEAWKRVSEIYKSITDTYVCHEEKRTIEEIKDLNNFKLILLYTSVYSWRIRTYWWW